MTDLCFDNADADRLTRVSADDSGVVRAVETINFTVMGH